MHLVPDVWSAGAAETIPCPAVKLQAKVGSSTGKWHWLNPHRAPAVRGILKVTNGTLNEGLVRQEPLIELAPETTDAQFQFSQIWNAIVFSPWAI